MSLFYGPVLSRRFGYSLGIDIIPFKICSYDCIYCQLGKTTKKTRSRKSYVKIDIEDFRNSLSAIVNGNKRIDYITFSGSGEPTLNTDIGTLIQEVKKITQIPVAVLTNGSLLYKEDVVESIKDADLIKISLDAPDQKRFEIINKPHPKIKFAHLSSGFDLLLESFRGKIWVEIMLIKDINDSLDTAHEYRAFLENLKNTQKTSSIEKIHLNTPVRPTESSGVFIPDHERLMEIKEILGTKAEIINGPDIDVTENMNEFLNDDIMELTRRRPVTARDISTSLQVNLNEVIKNLKILLDREKIKSRTHNNKKYYYA